MGSPAEGGEQWGHRPHREGPTWLSLELRSDIREDQAAGDSRAGEGWMVASGEWREAEV